MPCAGFITDPTRDALDCNSKVDVVIVLDGSASLGNHGWWSSKEAAHKLVASFGASGDGHVAVLLYGGPETIEAYNKCVGASNDTPAVDMEAGCGMHWVSHFHSGHTDFGDRCREHGMASGCHHDLPCLDSG